MKPFDLTGRVAIVTGGNGGIGLGMARGMADAGATILIAGRDREKSAGAVREIEAAGGKADAVEVDVLQPESCRAMIATATERFGRLDILVNNAGTNIRKQPQDYTLDRKSVLEGKRASVRVDPGGGRIIKKNSNYNIITTIVISIYII